METDEDTDQVFSRRLTLAISTRFEASGDTRADLARGAGMARSTLDRSLDAGRPFRPAELHSIARVLKVKASALMDEAEPVAA